VKRKKSEASKYLLQRYYETTRRLPLHELLQDLTWIGNPDSIGAPPLCAAFHEHVLGTDDVVEILEYLVDRNHALVSSRDQEGSLPLHLACRRGVSFAIVQSLVNRNGASVKSVTPQGDLPLFLACETRYCIPEPSLDTIFILMKLYPELVLCCVPVVSIAKTMLEDLLSDSNALSQALEENKQLKAENAGLERKLEQSEAENADLAKQFLDYKLDNHF
jgi:hypothetical protein